MPLAHRPKQVKSRHEATAGDAEVSLLVRSVALADVAVLNPRLADTIQPTTLVSFVPMAAVTEVTGEIVREEVRPYVEVARGFTPFKSDDVIMAKITPCFQNGKIAHAKLSQPWGFGSTEFHVVRADVKQLLPRYVFHFLRQDYIRVAGERRMTGSAGQRRVPQSYLSHLEIPLPPLPEQKRIAEILDQAEALRAKRRAALALLDELTQSIFLDMFGDAEVNSSRWPVKKVEEYVFEFQGGKSLESIDDDNSMNRVLKVSAVTGMKFRPFESKPVPDAYAPPKEHFVKPNDLLFSRANTTELVGAVAYVSECSENLLLPDKLWRFVWKNPGEIHPLFIWFLFQTRPVRREIGNRATGTSGSMKNISKAKLNGIPTILPPFDIQELFANRVKSVENIKTELRKSLADFDALFASLQYRAFRGLL